MANSTDYINRLVAKLNEKDCEVAALLREVARLRDVLDFYATADEDDGGKMARNALKPALKLKLVG